MDRARIARLGEDGFEYMGDIAMGGVVVVGDPLVLGRTPANGAYAATRTAAGRWQVFVRAEGDAIIEVVAVAEFANERLTDLYDEAHAMAELPTHALRVAILDATLKDDESVRLAMYEPDLEGLPLLTDRGCVIAGDPEHPVIVRIAGEPAELVSASLGPISSSVPTQPYAEE